ncbi:MAG: dual specificity protein phosphatase family protein [Dehalococcoidia bacterium]|nr:dual specificity protein phosphatase family protein [Dehalococcoidia bacterium]
MILLPHADISPITEFVSIGGMTAYSNHDALRKFGLLLNVAWELADYREEYVLNRTIPPEPSKLKNGQEIHHARLDDNDHPEEQAQEIERAVKLVTEARSAGHRVLVTCAAGRNRSGIVIAEHLIQTGWGSAEKTIATIQAARHKALTNDAFVAWLRRSR